MNEAELKDGATSPRVMIVAPAAPPYGGMANQAILLEKYLLKEGIRTVQVHTNRTLRSLDVFLDDLPGIRTLIREVFFLFRSLRGALRCRVIHIFACSHLYFFLHVVPCILTGRLLRKRVIVNFRGGQAERFFKGTGKCMLPVLAKSDMIIVPGKFLKDIFSSLGVMVSIVPNMLEIEMYPYRPPVETDATVFICTRNFEPYYDIPTLIKAFALVKNDLPESTLRLVGDGSQRSFIERMITGSGLNGAVHLVGRVSPEKIPHYLNTSDIFVNSSVVDNYPNSILEAFAAGLPVITTRTGGIPQIVTHRQNGLMVAPQDYKTLAQTMVTLATEYRQKVKLSGAGRRTAEMHSWKGLKPLLIKAYGFNK